MTQPTTDPVDEVINHVLPRYREPAFELPLSYDEDVRRIVRAFHAAAPDRRKELVDRLSITPWAAVKYRRSNRTILQIPWGHYFPSEKLRRLFDGLSGIVFIDPRRRALCSAKVRAVLEACGVPTRLGREWGAALSHDELSEVRQATGWRSSDGEFIDDYSIRDLENVLESISKRQPRWQDRSFALWDCLHDVLRHSGEDFFWGKYEAWEVKTKRMLRAARFPAFFVRELQRIAWLPGGEDRLKRPSELSLADLPAKFRRGASPLLVRVLGFRTDAAEPPADNDIIAIEILRVSVARPTAKTVKAGKQRKASKVVRKKRASR